MHTVGIYFGPKSIEIAVVAGKRLLNRIEIPLSQVTSSDLEDKVPQEIKIVGLITEALRMNKIEAKEAFLSLSGRDVIVRTFEIPDLPKDELASAIAFEAKKYIPFKIEELVFDYQLELDRASRVNTVLFVGMKKEALARYFSVFSQINLKVSRIEYAGFGLARALKSEGAKETGIYGLLCIDSGDGDEINFTVSENGLLLFNRDIALASSEPQPVASLDKLKAEIRVSLDYYQRKFPGKNMQKLFVFANQAQFQEVETYLSELGHSSRLVNFNKVVGKAMPYSSGLLKAFGVSLARIMPGRVRLNLADIKDRAPKATGAGMELDPLALFRDIRIDFRFVILGGLICAATFGYGIYQATPFKLELNNLVSSRIKVDRVDNTLSSDKLKEIDLSYKKRLSKLDALIKKQLYLTQTLDSIPRAIPTGVWLTRFSLDKKDGERTQLNLEGESYLRDSDKEFESVNMFLENLKNNPVFFKYFSDIRINSITKKQEGKVATTSFSLSCRNYKEGK